MFQDHAFLLHKNTGMSRRMCGEVLVELIFVADKGAIWMHNEIDDFHDVYQNAVSGIQKQAAAAGVSLSFSSMIGHFSYNGHLDPNDSSALFTLIQTQFLHERGFANFTDYAASRRRACGTDEMALIFVMERQFRAFAQHTEELEYCVLTQDNDAHAIAHELLHLFGAVDLYYPYQIYGLTMKYFPQSVMCTHEGMEVDPLNQYLIGWKTELPYKAREFMEKLTDFTVARYGEANNLEYHRNREDELLQRAVPYPSLQSVRKRVEVCDPWAEYLLGLCYRDGIGVERNLAKAEEYFSRSGRTGLIIAAVAHAQIILCRGIRTEADRENLWLLLKYNSNDHLKLNSLKYACQLTGVGCNKDPGEAVRYALHQYQESEWYDPYTKRSARLYRIAERLSSKIPELYTVVSELRKEYDLMLEKDDPDLQFIIAKLLEEGEYVQRDLSGAFTLYQESARRYNRLSAEKVASFYLYGIGVQRNPQLAQEWRNFTDQCRRYKPMDAFCRVMEPYI